MDPEQNPHVCGGCTSHLVQEIARQQLSSRYWSLTLECPECAWAGTGVFDDEIVARFDEATAVGFEQLVMAQSALAETALA
jgi:hypothetical protein